MLVAGVVVLWPAQWGGFVGLTIVSGQSMQPTYETYDVVVTVAQSSYAPGDVISYVVPEGQPGAGGHVIHRIAEVDASGGDVVYVTIGDNNPTADEWVIGTDDVIGRAVFHVPGAGTIFTPEMFPYLLAGAAGLIVTVLLWSPMRRGADDDETDDGAREDIGALRAGTR